MQSIGPHTPMLSLSGLSNSMSAPRLELSLAGIWYLKRDGRISRGCQGHAPYEPISSAAGEEKINANERNSRIP
jgi:hypothetical protein